MTFTTGQSVEVELVIHQRNRRKDGTITTPPAVWKPAKFVKPQGHGGLCEYRTPLGIEKKVFPLQRIRVPVIKERA